LAHKFRCFSPWLLGTHRQGPVEKQNNMVGGRHGRAKQLSSWQTRERRRGMGQRHVPSDLIPQTRPPQVSTTFQHLGIKTFFST
jgi:hypothetical protein